MTIIEAIKSDRPFKRPHMNWWVFKGHNSLLGFLKDGSPTYFYQDSILASDWEIMSVEEWEEFKTPRRTNSSNVISFSKKTIR
jgi:hypothetical protein